MRLDRSGLLASHVEAMPASRGVTDVVHGCWVGVFDGDTVGLVVGLVEGARDGEWDGAVVGAGRNVGDERVLAWSEQARL